MSDVYFTERLFLHVCITHLIASLIHVIQRGIVSLLFIFFVLHRLYIYLPKYLFKIFISLIYVFTQLINLTFFCKFINKKNISQADY